MPLSKKERRERYLKNKARRLNAEIGDIRKVLYDADHLDLEGRVFMSERERDDVVRSVVLQFQTAMEDIVNTLLRNRLLEITSEEWADPRVRARSGSKIISSFLDASKLNYEGKLTLLKGLGVLRAQTLKKLIVLYQLRNSCSHTWLLNTHIRRGVKPNSSKRPLLHYNKGNLYHLSVIEEFVADYAALYSKLFLKSIND